MKTTKKGFTLIELIVVIAIIGVLAAILVPAMMGYIKKSKIQSANTAASTIAKAANSALTELDEGDYELRLNAGTAITGDVIMYINGVSHTPAADTITFDNNGLDRNHGYCNTKAVFEYMKSYYDPSTKDEIILCIEKMVCKFAAAKSGAYVGSYPAVLTAKNYDFELSRTDISYNPTISVDITTAELKTALRLAGEKYNKQHNITTGDTADSSSGA